MAKNQYPQDLVKFLQDNPKVTKVYMADDKRWLARQHPAYRTMVTAEHILASVKPAKEEAKKD